MSLQQTVDGILNAGVEIYTAKQVASNNADLARQDERQRVTGEFEERFFEERERQADGFAAKSQELLKIGAIGFLAFAGLVIASRVRG